MVPDTPGDRLGPASTPSGLALARSLSRGMAPPCEDPHAGRAAVGGSGTFPHVGKMSPGPHSKERPATATGGAGRRSSCISRRNATFCRKNAAEGADQASRTGLQTGMGPPPSPRSRLKQSSTELHRLSLLHLRTTILPNSRKHADPR